MSTLKQSAIMKKFIFLTLFFLSKNYGTSQVLVDCNNLELDVDTFYIGHTLNTQVNGNLIYRDTNMVVYPVLRLLLQDTTIVNTNTMYYLSFLKYPIDTIFNFSFNMNFKNTTYSNGTVVKGFIHLYDSDVPTDSIATCYLPITLILQQALGFSESTLLKPIQFYPNPVKDELNIEIAVASTLKIFDLNGRLVLERELDSGLNNINTSSLKAGVYSMSISNSSFTRQTRLLKLEE